MAITTQKRLDMTGLRQSIQQLLSLPEGSVRGLQAEVPSQTEAYLSLYPKKSSVKGVATIDFRDQEDSAMTEEFITLSVQTTIGIEAVGKNAWDILMKLWVGIQSSQGKAKLRELNIGLEGVMPIELALTTTETHWVEKYSGEWVIHHQHQIKASQVAVAMVAFDVNVG